MCNNVDNADGEAFDGGSEYAISAQRFWSTRGHNKRASREYILMTERPVSVSTALSENMRFKSQFFFRYFLFVLYSILPMHYTYGPLWR